MGINHKPLHISKSGNCLRITSNSKSFNKFFLIYALLLGIIVLYFVYYSGQIENIYSMALLWSGMVLVIYRVLILTTHRIEIQRKENVVTIKSSLLSGEKEHIFKEDKLRLVFENKGKKYILYFFDGKGLLRINPPEPRGGIVGNTALVIGTAKIISNEFYMPFTKNQVDEISNFVGVKLERRK